MNSLVYLLLATAGWAGADGLTSLFFSANLQWAREDWLGKLPTEVKKLDIVTGDDSSKTTLYQSESLIKYLWNMPLHSNLLKTAGAVIWCLRCSLQGAKTALSWKGWGFPLGQQSVHGHVLGKSLHCLWWMHKKQRALKIVWGHPEPGMTMWKFVTQLWGARWYWMGFVSWKHNLLQESWLFPSAKRGGMVCLPVIVLLERCTCFKDVDWYTSLELQDYY